MKVLFSDHSLDPRPSPLDAFVLTTELPRPPVSGLLSPLKWSPVFCLPSPGPGPSTLVTRLFNDVDPCNRCNPW